MPRAWVEDTWLARDRSRTDRWGSGSRWRVRWREETAGGPRLRTKRFAKKSDAEELAAKLDNDIRASVYRDPDLGKTLLREVAAEWLATHLRVKEATSVRYERELRMYVLPKFGSRAVGTITRAEVANWVADLHHGRAPARYMIRGTRPPEYQPVGQQRRPLGAASIEHIMAVFGPVMRWALEQGRIDRDPTAGLSLPRPETSEHVYLTHTQVRDLAEAAEQVSGSHQDAVLVYTLAYTGVRINEALAAQIRSLDTTRRQLRITQTWTKGRDSDRKLGAPKSWERRTVPLPGFAATELAGLVKDRPPGEFIFTAKRGGAVHDHNWRPRVFDPAGAQAGLGGLGLTPHKLRHTAASAAIAAGADPKVVQQMLGHASAAMTLDIYGHLWPSRLGEVADAIETARAAALGTPKPAPTDPPPPALGM